MKASRKEQPLLWSQAERAGVSQPEEEKAAGRPQGTLQHLKESYKRAGEGLSMRVCSDRARGHGFKLRVDLGSVIRRNSLL